MFSHKNKNTHPIDKALDACIEQDGSTAGMIQCTDKGYVAWDRQLRTTSNLTRHLKTGQQAALKAQLQG